MKVRDSQIYDKWVTLNYLINLFGVDSFRDLPEASDGKIIEAQKVIFKEPRKLANFTSNKVDMSGELTFSFTGGVIKETHGGIGYMTKFKVIKPIKYINLKEVYNIRR